MRADFTVPEQQLGEMTMGQQANFGLTETEFPYRGRITGIDPKIDPASRLVSVRAEVENPDGANRGIRTIEVDGERYADRTIPIAGVTGHHEIRVVLGRATEPR